MGKFIRHSNVDEVKLIQVIEVKSIVGEGTNDDPVRAIREYFTPEGTLLARTDTQRIETGHWKGGENDA